MIFWGIVTLDFLSLWPLGILSRNSFIFTYCCWSSCSRMAVRADLQSLSEISDISDTRQSRRVRNNHKLHIKKQHELRIYRLLLAAHTDVSRENADVKSCFLNVYIHPSYSYDTSSELWDVTGHVNFVSFTCMHVQFVGTCTLLTYFCHMLLSTSTPVDFRGRFCSFYSLLEFHEAENTSVL